METKKKMYYAGKRRIGKSGTLGHCFIEMKRGKEGSNTCFRDNKNYCIGAMYEITYLEENKLKIGSYLKKDLENQELLKEWIQEELYHKSFYNEEKQRKAFAKEGEKIIENMTLKELKEKVKSDWRFKKIIFYWLMNG